MRVYEIFIAELGTYVKFKDLDANEAEAFVDAAVDMDRDEYITHVLENVVFNMKTEIVDSLKMMTRASAKASLEALFNGCIMLNPGLDIENWVRLCYANAELRPEDSIVDALKEIEAFTTQTLVEVNKKAKARKITKAKFLNLNKYLRERVIGQDEAIDVIVNALKRSQTGLSDDGRPLGVFLFAGSSGVGKTHLARELHKYLYGDEYDIVRVDCGELQHKHDNQKLIGSPPGYIGHDEGGQLTNQMAEHPDTVVLLDEVEKAHIDIWNTFLRVFDEGILTDNKGRQINFRNAIIIMTTNLGNEKVVEALTGKGMGFNSRVAMVETTKVIPNRDQVVRYAMESIKSIFRPEFLNRIDQTVIFNHLSYENFYNIAELEMRVIEDKLSKRGISLKFDTDVLDVLINTGVDSVRGARGIAKVRREQVENLLADVLLENPCPRGTLLDLTLSEGKFVVDIRKPTPRKSKAI